MFEQGDTILFKEPAGFQKQNGIFLSFKKDNYALVQVYGNMYWVPIQDIETIVIRNGILVKV